MIFTHRNWERFCRNLEQQGIQSVPVREILIGEAKQPYLVLKHDVETDVSKACRMARIEHKYGHCSTYYVQAYLLAREKNIDLLRQMQQMGHEISYHYDVMDSSKGDLDRAMIEFKINMQKFEDNGFRIDTVCQHGNPIVERNGYHSNRDFFRALPVQQAYPNLADVMVNLKEKAKTEYLYFSDAGRCFNLIFDPINNDVVNSEDKNLPCEDLAQVMEQIGDWQNAIISVHPHRWCPSVTGYVVKTVIFKAIRFLAKQAAKVPVLRKIISRFYFLAKRL